MEQVNARRALELLIDVVDQYGEDYVYEKRPLTLEDGEERGNIGIGCRYQYKEQPSCLVGHVLFRAGAPLKNLIEADVNGVPANKLDLEKFGLDGGARMVLEAAQAHQDNGENWGLALDAARFTYEKILKKGVAE